MTEVERRKVTVLRKPNDPHLEISPTTIDGVRWFVLTKKPLEESEPLAKSLSDSALATWAFDQHGVRTITYRYDLALGDMGR